MTLAKIPVEYISTVDNKKYSLELTPSEYLQYREEQQIDSLAKAQEIHRHLPVLDSRLNQISASRDENDDGYATGSEMYKLYQGAHKLRNWASALVEPMHEQKVAERQASKITLVLSATVKGSPNPFDGRLHYAVLGSRKQKATYVSVKTAENIECCKVISPKGYGYLLHIAEGIRSSAPGCDSFEYATRRQECAMEQAEKEKESRELDSRCRSLARAEGRTKPRGSRGKKH